MTIGMSRRENVGATVAAWFMWGKQTGTEDLPMRRFEVLGIAAIFGAAVQVHAAPVEEPELTLTGIAVHALWPWEQRLEITLSVNNRNPFPVPIESVDYTVDVGGVLLARGQSRAPVTLPPMATAPIRLSAVTDLLSFFNETGHTLHWNRPLEYRLHGRVRLGIAGQTIPFEAGGSITLPQLKPPQPKPGST
jgi:LEA14-like dessication related protein